MSNSEINFQEASSLANVCETPRISRIAPENGIAESRTFNYQDGLQLLPDEQECCDYEGMIACAH
jgi:hypothetical protein